MAPDLASLANTCHSLSAITRQCYCRHCGTVFKSGEPRVLDEKSHRASHPETCEWPNGLDPFRFVYPIIEWGMSFVAGGWATFLHHREHRQYDNAWRNGGEVAQRDLDVFYMNDYPSQPLICRLIMMNSQATIDPLPVRVGRIVKKASLWIDDRLRDQTEENADCKMWLHPLAEKPLTLVVRASEQFGLSIYENEDDDIMDRRKDRKRQSDTKDYSIPSFGVQVDIIGRLNYLTSPFAILDAFDFPWCRVGFYVQFDKDTGQWKRNWILSPSHNLPYSPASEEHDVLLFSDKSREERLQDWKKNDSGTKRVIACTRKRQREEEESSSSGFGLDAPDHVMGAQTLMRMQKYEARGYGSHVMCDCPVIPLDRLIDHRPSAAKRVCLR